MISRMQYVVSTRVRSGLVHGLSWTGLAAPTTPWQRATVSKLIAILDTRQWSMTRKTVKLWDGLCPDFFIEHTRILVTQWLDFTVGGVDLEDGGHHSWSGCFMAYFVHRFNGWSPQYHNVDRCSVNDEELHHSGCLLQAITDSDRELVVLIISKGDRNAILARDLHDVFSLVDVFSASYFPSIAGIASPTTCPWGCVWLDLAGFIGHTCLGNEPLNKLS
ncbi:hypothetical protein TIFTF001_034335 [Ficus carica]|uniref:Uncharacterized protein n=1 Tax=Ficus carica TaxID=3494 RepID=A0AA88J509_FICCA|nr:hypothetical protein TIFTF001_034335 [Ficus carica]